MARRVLSSGIDGTEAFSLLMSAEEAGPPLFAGPLQARRRDRAELAAWTAPSMQHHRQPRDWQGFPVLARELLGTRPLVAIGLMTMGAETTLAMLEMQGLRGKLYAS